MAYDNKPLTKSIIDNIDTDWQEILLKVNKDSLKKLDAFHKKETDLYEPDVMILPPVKDVFAAFNLFNFAELRTVFLFQDPYINIDKKMKIPEAHGIAISVKDGVKVPPTLRNFIKELKSDLGEDYISEFIESSDLTKWSKSSKSLMLNASLTVRQYNSNTHADEWKGYTDSIIEYISENKKDVIFVLLGNWAKKKSKLIDKTKHIIISSSHPSPLSAYRGFIGSKIFSKCNEESKKLGYDNIF